MHNFIVPIANQMLPKVVCLTKKDMNDVFGLTIHEYSIDPIDSLREKITLAIQKTDELLKRDAVGTERGYSLIRKYPL